MLKKRNYHVVMVYDEDIKKNFGAVVRALRVSRNLTQEKLAEYIEVQTQTISAIESGKSFISCEVLTNLSNYFEVDPSIFFTSKVRILSEKDVDYIDAIKRLLPTFNSDKLKEIYDILLVMHK